MTLCAKEKSPPGSRLARGSILGVCELCTRGGTRCTWIRANWSAREFLVSYCIKLRMNAQIWQCKRMSAALWLWKYVRKEKMHETDTCYVGLGARILRSPNLGLRPWGPYAAKAANLIRNIAETVDSSHGIMHVMNNSKIFSFFLLTSFSASVPRTSRTR